MKSDQSKYFTQERLNTERSGNIQDSDPLFLAEFFLAPIIIGLIIGIVLSVYLPNYNGTAFLVALIIGIVFGIYLGLRVKNKKGNSKYYLPIEDSNDINDWNVRDTIIRNQKLDDLNKAVYLELEKFKDDKLKYEFKLWDKKFYAHNRIYDKNDLKSYKECWVVFDNKFEKKCISYCENVYPNVGSWAVHNMKDNLLGEQDYWFESLESAFEELFNKNAL